MAAAAEVKINDERKSDRHAHRMQRERAEIKRKKKESFTHASRVPMER
jgi:hypothetical protein